MSKKNVSNVAKCHNVDNIALATEAINSIMRRKGLGLGDMYSAASRMIEDAVNSTILNLRAEGCSIHKIARTIHMDDSRVSKIIKSAKEKECCKKPCKPCKPCNPCKTSKKCGSCKK